MFSKNKFSNKQTGTPLPFYFQNYAEINQIKKLNQHKPFDRMTVDIAEFIINYFKGRFVVKMITELCVCATTENMPDI